VNSSLRRPTLWDPEAEGWRILVDVKPLKDRQRTVSRILSQKQRLGREGSSGAGYVRRLLDERIKARGLEGRVEAYVSDKALYLEKV
jgi:hypothetical protein